MLHAANSIASFVSTFNIQLLICEFVLLLSGLKLPGRPLKLRNRLFPIGVALAMVYCAVFSYALFPGYYATLNSYMGVSFILVWLSSVAIIYCCFRIRILNVVFISICGWTLQHFLAYVSVIIQDGVSLPEESHSLILFVVHVLILALFYFLLARPSIRLLLKDLNVAFSVTVTVYALLVICVINYLYYESGGANSSLHICQLINCISLLTVEFGFTRLLDDAHEKQMLSNILTATEKQYKMMVDNNELLNIKYHDIKRHIEALRITDAGYGAVEEDSETNEIISTYALISRTGNSALDTLLTQKALECDRRHISFSHMADTVGLKEIQSVDLYVMLSNAIDNAIEAVRDLDETRRIITLEIRHNDAFIRFCIDNYCDKKLDFENGIPVTTKTQNGYHGFGLKSIKRIAEKYDGNMTIDVENGIFTLVILIPRKAADR